MANATPSNSGCFLPWRRAELDVRPPSGAIDRGGRPLDILTWNLGYGGLGAGSDFRMDGGKHVLPPSRGAVVENADGIAEHLARRRPAIVLLQELARASFLNRWVDVAGRVRAALAGYGSVYTPDFTTPLLPGPLGIETGLALFHREGDVEGASVLRLSQEPRRMGLRKDYRALFVRLRLRGEPWTVVVAHTAAFDPDASVRVEQLGQILEACERERAEGRRVVAGGDWNLLLVETEFPHTTRDEHLFWVHPIPDGVVPEGWSVKADARVPSVRTLERSYRANENFTGVVDGFFTAPEVVAAVEGEDLGFRHSDHNPVRLLLTA